MKDWESPTDKTINLKEGVLDICKIISWKREKKNAVIEWYQSMSEKNISFIEQTMEMFINPSSVAGQIASWIDMTKEVTKINTTQANKLMKSQLNGMRLDVTSEALKNWGGIYAGAVASFGKKGLTFFQKSMDEVSNDLMDTYSSKKMEDVAAAQYKTYNAFREHIEGGVCDFFEALNSMNSAIDIWIQKTLESYGTPPRNISGTGQENRSSQS